MTGSNRTVEYAVALASASTAPPRPSGPPLLAVPRFRPPARPPGQKEQRHGVIGGERAQVERRPGYREQCRGEEPGLPPEHPARRIPQQRCRAEHEDQRQYARSGQPA